MMIFQRVMFHYVSITVWLIMGVKVETYKSGCSGEYCFVISDYNNNSERFDQSSAVLRCQSSGTQLIEIRNQDIQNSLVDFISSIYIQGLNGSNVLTNGNRSSNNWVRLNGKNISSLNINNQTDASYAYGYLMQTTSGFVPFASTPTDNKGGFICSGLSDCSGGVTISGLCYKTFIESLSWYDARNRCLDEKGDLASFDYITTNAGFTALNGSWINTSNSYWIGIRREWWTWQGSNFDVKHSNWMAGHPINNQTNTDCLCLSTNAWMWTECGCTQQLPFVCFSVNNSITPSTTTTSTKTPTTSTTTHSSTRTTTSTTTTSTTASKAASLSASENGRVSTSTVPATVTSNSTPTANDTENLKQSMRLSREAAIGIGVGVGIGGTLVIAALMATVILLCRNRGPIRCHRKKNSDAKVRPPRIPTQNSKNMDQITDEMENPYALIVPSSPEGSNASTNANEDSSQTFAVYAQLGFCAEPHNHRNGSVKTVPNKTKPSLMPKPPATIKKFNVDDTIDAEVTVV